MLRRRSLARRLAVAAAGTFLLVGLLLGAALHQRLQAFERDATFEFLEGRAPAIADRLEPTLRAGDAATLAEQVGELAELAGVRITVVPDAGPVLAESDGVPEEMDEHRYRHEIDAAFNEGTGRSVRYSATLRRDLAYVAHRVELADGRRVVVRVARPVGETTALASRAMRMLAPAAAILLLAVLVAIVVVAHRAGRAIEAYADTARRYAQGDLGRRLAPGATSELAKLAAALNRLAARLGDRLDELERSQAEQRAVLQSMSNGTIALDREQRFLSVNQAAEGMIGHLEPAIRGRLLQEVVREPELHRFVASAMTRGGRRTEELRFGERGERTLRVVSEPLRTGEGPREGLLLVLEDVTRLRRLEAMRSDFAANVSHELRTPITNIKGYVETMLDVGLDDRDQSRRFLEIVRGSANRLEAIVEDLLALASLEAAGAPQGDARAACPVAALARSATTTFRDAAVAKSMRIATEVPAELEVLGTMPLLETAVGNLVSNAVKYGPPGSTITIRARAVAGVEEPEVAIEVLDEGPGIDAEHLPRLFERFYRVDRARSRALGGTGLGLAIVKHVALAHGGRAEVESAPGKGSLFRITLPASAGASGGR